MQKQVMTSAVMILSRIQDILMIGLIGELLADADNPVPPGAPFTNMDLF